MSQLDEFTHAEQAAEFIFARTSLRPRIALVLGSGLGGFADELQNPTRIPYAGIPFFPHSTAVGHAGQLVMAPVGWPPRRRHARPRSSLRGLLSTASRISHARFRPYGN